MISFYVTKAGEPFTVGRSKNDTFLTIGTRADNDIVLTGIHAGNRFLMVKIQTGILKVSCVASVRGLKVNKSSLSSGQDKLIPGSGKAPITLEDYTIYVKIGDADASWSKFAELKRGVKLEDVEKSPPPPRKPKPAPQIPKLSGGETDFFNASDKTPHGKKVDPKKISKFDRVEKFGVKKKIKEETESIFDGDVDDNDDDGMEFFSANGKTESPKGKGVFDSPVSDMPTEMQKDRLEIEKEEAAKPIDLETAQEQPSPVKTTDEASPFGDEMLVSFDTSEVSEKLDDDETKIADFPDESPKASASIKKDKVSYSALFDSEDDDVVSFSTSKESEHKPSERAARRAISGKAGFDMTSDFEETEEEDAEEMLMTVEEIVDEPEADFKMAVGSSRGISVPMEEEAEEEAVELDEFGEILEETSVSDDLDAMLSDIAGAVSGIGALPEKVMAVEAEPEMPPPASPASMKPQEKMKKAKKMRSAPPAQPVAMPAQDYVKKAALKKKVVKDIERKTTVRYYKQMVINKNFPLLVIFSREEIERIVQRDVAQVEAKEKVRVKREKPIVKVVPQFPGCICVPEHQEVDLTPENTEITFWITPVAEGKLPSASINVHYEGKIIQKIECPTRVAKSTAAKVTAGAAIISPVFFSAIETVGLDPKSQLETGFPIMKQVSNWLEAQSTSMLGEPILSGMTLLGLVIGFLAFIVAIVFFIRARPKKGDPIGEFLDFNLLKTEE